MEAWSDLWNPVMVLGGAGTIGVVSSPWIKSRGWLTPWCLFAILMAALSGTSSAADAASRGTLALSVGWGLLWVAALWPNRLPESVSHRQSELTLPMLLVLLSGLGLTVQAGDVMTLFMGVALTTCGASIMAQSQGQSTTANGVARSWDRSQNDTLVLLSLLMLGFLLLAAVTGSTRIETIAESLQASYVNHDAARYAIAGGGSWMLTLSITLIGTSLGGLALAAPFHSRVVDTSEATLPSRVAADLLLPRAVVLVTWLKLWPATITASESTAQLLVGVLAAITFIVPLLQVKPEQSLARQWMLLAVSQGGWLFLSVTAWSFGTKPIQPSEAWPVVEWNSPSAAQAAWLWLLLDGVALIGLFGVLAYLGRRERPITETDDLRGLRQSEPIAAVCATICLLSLSGVPLLAGFWSRLFVAMSAMNVRGEWGPAELLVPHGGLLLLTVLAAVSSVWTASIAGHAIWKMHFGLPLGQPQPAGTVGSLFVAVLASLILLGCGLLPGPLLSWLCEPKIGIE